jgi:hypothetical protein
VLILSFVPVFLCISFSFMIERPGKEILIFLPQSIHR